LFSGGFSTEVDLTGVETDVENLAKHLADETGLLFK
jgi:hypothetical protein